MGAFCFQEWCASGFGRVDAQAFAKLIVNFGARSCLCIPLPVWIAAALFLGAGTSSGQLRIVDYNTGGDARTGLDLVLAAIGAESVNGIAKPPDVFTLEEQTSSATTTQALVNLLNSIYGAGTYARTTLDVATTGSGRPTAIYNTKTVQLIGQQAVGTTSSTGAARQTLRIQLRPVGYTATADFYVYASHYKASTGSDNEARRNVEAQSVRANADALGQGAHIIFAGDYNIYRSSEAMYQTLLSAGNGQAFDPINTPGNWSGSSAFLAVHTQSPATTAAYGGQITGGMDDRFDFQLVTGEFLDSEGLSYISGSYHAFGNTGTHQLDGAITSGSASALQARLPGYTLQQATNVLNALSQVTDHLPVVADYQIPAMMSVTLGSSPLTVIRGASLSLGFTVANTAPVVAVNGADELDYTFSGTGGVTGSGSGLDLALGGGNAHTLGLNTATPGMVAGTVEVHSPSQGVANGDFSGNVSVTVLDHATPSFSLSLLQTNLVLDFGSVELSDGPESLSFSLYNLIGTAGFTAGLDFDGFSFSGDAAPFSNGISLSLFTNLTAGDFRTFSFLFDPAIGGAFESTVTLSFSDADLPGATARGDLTLILRGSATAIPEPGCLALAAAGAMLFLGRRRRRS